MKRRGRKEMGRGLCVCDSEGTRGRKMKRREGGLREKRRKKRRGGSGCAGVNLERKKRRKKKKKWGRESATCVCVNGWEKIALSSPCQPGIDTWQIKISFILNAQTFINYFRTPIILKSYLLTTDI
jgi:hypothetical protein